MAVRRIKRELWVPYRAKDVFRFFADANNLDSITPSWLHFRVLTQDTKIEKGALLEYHLKWHGVPLRWLTEITAWDPPYRFTDTQRKGPYKKWIHDHRFEERDGGTSIIDDVEYEIYGWFFEPLIHSIFVGPDINRIFDFRMRKMSELYGRREQGV
jgi:ligand-binding SRPBCC domain-containing protein